MDNKRIKIFQSSVSAAALVLAPSAAPVVLMRATGLVVALVGGSMTMLVLVAQLSTFALTEHYTTTQRQSLQIGDTIETSGVVGLNSSAGTTLVAPGDNKITTSGTNADAIFIKKSGDTRSAVNATGTTIITTGNNSNGVVMDFGTDLVLNSVTINAARAGILVSGSTGVSTITLDADTSITSVDVGIVNRGTLSMIGTHVTSTGARGAGVALYDHTSGSISGNAVIKTMGDDSQGIDTSLFLLHQPPYSQLIMASA